MPWSGVSHVWLFDSAGLTRDALVIEARLYSTPLNGDYSTDFFIDDLTVTAPASATIIVPPADNDQCENAGSSYLCVPYIGSTSAPSNDTDVAWHRFSAPKDGRYAISLAGSDYDTTLAIYDSCGSVPTATNDDYYPDGTSKILVDLSASQSCYIRIAGYVDAVGEYKLTVSLAADIDKNNIVDFDDLRLISIDWLQERPTETDIAALDPEVADQFTDVLDLAVFANEWLTDLQP